MIYLFGDYLGFQKCDCFGNGFQWFDDFIEAVYFTYCIAAVFVSSFSGFIPQFAFVQITGKKHDINTIVNGTTIFLTYQVLTHKKDRDTTTDTHRSKPFVVANPSRK